MKKSLIVALSAVVLLGMGFSSCTDKKTNEPEGKTGQVVKTEFTIKVPSRLASRMGVDATQADEAFNGMTEIRLIPFGEAVTATNEATINKLSFFQLGDITAGFAGSDEYSAVNAKVYSDLSMPLKTTHFLFYGKALTTGGDNFTNGALTPNNLTVSVAHPSDISFSPVQIYTGTDAYAGSTTGAGIVTLLNNIAAVKATVEGADKTWESVTEAENATLYQLYQNFITMHTGSSYAVQEALEDLYFALKNLAAEPATTIYQPLAVAIRDAIKDGGTIDETNKTFTITAAGYPADVNLPDGAARIAWDGTAKQFKPATGVGNAASHTEGLNVAQMNAYVYPADLRYFVNSSLKTSTSIQSNKYSNYTAWLGADGVIEKLYPGTDNTVVQANTRSVAIKDEIQYAVGRLDTKVNKLSAEKYYDHNGEEVDVTNGFALTAVLIGGQKQVDWKFETVTTSTDEYTIYDKTMNMETLNSVANDTSLMSDKDAGTNYTLALETEKGKEVYVALEFRNRGGDFMGADGLIPAGGKFYLTGKLDPKSTTGVTGYDADKKGLDRVFTQDFKTIANFTIGAGTATEGNNTGLGAATNGIPDLRAPEVELGLSVNLQWQAGLEFTVEF